MKIKHLFVAIIAIAALYLSACQKELNPDDIISRVDSTGNPTVGDSVYLDKYYFIEMFPNLGSDTLTKMYFQYDNLKRVVSILDTSHERSLSYSSWYKKEIFFYNGNDTLPYKRNIYFEQIGFNPGKDTTTNFFSYDNLGQIILDSTTFTSKYLSTLTNITTYNVSKTIKTYTHSSNNIYRSLQVTNLINSSSLGLQRTVKDTAVLDPTGNIVSVKSSEIVNTVLNTPSYYSSSYIYDNKPSAISKLNIKNLLSYNYVFDDRFNYDIICFLSHNNILKEQKIRAGSINNFDYSSFYTYNANGFPSFVTINYTTPPIYTDKEIFIYKAL